MRRSREPHQQTLTTDEKNTKDNDRAPNGKDSREGNSRPLDPNKPKRKNTAETGP